jgi:hypothetical protein
MDFKQENKKMKKTVESVETVYTYTVKVTSEHMHDLRMSARDAREQAINDVLRERFYQGDYWMKRHLAKLEQCQQLIEALDKAECKTEKRIVSKEVEVEEVTA